MCAFLYRSEQLAANPMQLVGRPKLAKPLPKALPRTAVEALIETVGRDQDSKRQTDWAERDLAIILTAYTAPAALKLGPRSMGFWGEEERTPVMRLIRPWFQIDILGWAAG